MVTINTHQCFAMASSHCLYLCSKLVLMILEFFVRGPQFPAMFRFQKSDSICLALLQLLALSHVHAVPSLAINLEFAQFVCMPRWRWRTMREPGG